MSGIVEIAPPTARSDSDRKCSRRVSQSARPNGITTCDLVGRLPPCRLVGLGDGSLARALAQFAELASLPFTCRAQPGRLDQPGFDLRQALREAITPA